MGALWEKNCTKINLSRRFFMDFKHFDIFLTGNYPLSSGRTPELARNISPHIHWIARPPLCHCPHVNLCTDLVALRAGSAHGWENISTVFPLYFQIENNNPGFLSSRGHNFLFKNRFFKEIRQKFNILEKNKFGFSKFLLDFGKTWDLLDFPLRL